MPLLLGVVALVLLLAMPGTQAGGAVLIGPVPVAAGTSPVAAAAALLLLLAFFAVTTAAAGRWLREAAETERERRAREQETAPGTPETGREANVKAAGVVMVGPVPIAFGSDPRLLRFTLLLAAALTLLWLAAVLVSR